MIKLYQPQSPKKLKNKPFPIFVELDHNNGVSFFYSRMSNNSAHQNNLWSVHNTGANRGVLALLCPLDLSKWSKEDD